MFYRNFVLSNSDVFISDEIIDLKNIDKYTNSYIFQFNYSEQEVVDKIPIVTNDKFVNSLWKKTNPIEIFDPKLVIKSLFKF